MNDPRDARIKELEAEVERLNWELTSTRSALRLTEAAFDRAAELVQQMHAHVNELAKKAGLKPEPAV